MCSSDLVTATSFNSCLAMLYLLGWPYLLLSISFLKNACALPFIFLLYCLQLPLPSTSMQCLYSLHYCHVLSRCSLVSSGLCLFSSACSCGFFLCSCFHRHKSSSALGHGGLDGYCGRSEEHTSELQSLTNLVCRLLLEKKNKKQRKKILGKL